MFRHENGNLTTSALMNKTNDPISENAVRFILNWKISRDQICICCNGKDKGKEERVNFAKKAEKNRLLFKAPKIASTV